MYAGLVLVVCFGVAVGLQKIDIAKDVDEALPGVNAAIKARGMVKSQVPDFGFEAAPVFINTFLSDLSTIVRTGEAVMWTSDDDSLNFSIQLGLKDAALDVDLCPMMHGPFHWKLSHFEARVEFKLVAEEANGPCTTLWNGFTITRIEGQNVITADSQWNGKPMPGEIIDAIITRYNEVDNSPQVLQILNKYVNVCTLLSPFLNL